MAGLELTTIGQDRLRDRTLFYPGTIGYWNRYQKSLRIQVNARDGINDDLKAPPFTMFPM